MKILNVLSGALLTFVLVSLAVAIADTAGWLNSQVSEIPQTKDPGNRLVAFYFHTSTRCMTCRAIENHAHDALADEIKAGSIDWQIVNYEESKNRHFAGTFKLLCPSVILVHYRDGEVARWKNLERVWELNEERSEFIDYVRSELATFKEMRP